MEVNAQKLLQEFENIAFRDGETVDQFGMRITNLVAILRTLGETVEDARVVKKFLRVVPSRFTPVVVSIKMFCDMKTMKVEELVGRLRAAEDRLDVKVEHIVDKTGQLLLAEEEWMEKHKHRFHAGPKEGGGVKLTSEGTPRRKGRCRNYGIYGHWAQDCKRPKKEKKKEPKQAEADVAIGGAEHGALLLAECDVDAVHRSTQTVHMTEKVIPVDVPEGVCITTNRLYLAKFGSAPPVCFLAHSEDLSWRLHARFGHLNFKALNGLSAKNLVEGMPVVKRVEKICDGCVLGGSTDQQSDSFVVHYETSDENLTTAGMAGDLEIPAVDGAGHDPADQDGVVDPLEVAPNSPNTPEPAQVQGHGWATPPNQNSENSEEGPVRFRTMADLLDSTDVIHDFEDSGVFMLAADEPTNIDQALEERITAKVETAHLGP
ncbi:unnamed protein product [Miscanthus lutarioriparius]|uniref:GAG-pre-integrase domain-containing protein n=1 Tax=Miscanthus lutarioriparius TaxID=422564 RepID=A0A811Q781_9POAL|nr:unnamed protein product [Miscanthus lutarioriparius]